MQETAFDAVTASFSQNVDVDENGGYLFVTWCFWHVTWFTQAHVTRRFPPYLLKKDAVTASKASDW